MNERSEHTIVSSLKFLYIKYTYRETYGESHERVNKCSIQFKFFLFFVTLCENFNEPE